MTALTKIILLELDLRDDNETKMLCTGDKIVVSIEITPLDKKQNEWKYFKGSDSSLYHENARTLDDYKFSIISDLSRYGAYLEHTKFNIPSRAYVNLKRIARVELSKGKYNVKVKLLDFQKTDNSILYLKINEHWKKQLIRF